MELKQRESFTFVIHCVEYVELYWICRHIFGLAAQMAELLTEKCVCINREGDLREHVWVLMKSRAQHGWKGDTGITGA